jgi:hypothetical protein
MEREEKIVYQNMNSTPARELTCASPPEARAEGAVMKPPLPHSEDHTHTSPPTFYKRVMVMASYSCK